MQSTVLPSGTCDEIDKLCRNFIWGGDENHRTVHLISWSNLCKPKDAGGLGLRSTRAANSAFLMKGPWNFCTKPDTLWVSLLRNKYKCEWRDFPRLNSKRKGSNFWNGLVNTWDSFRNTLSWDVGNGADIRFWQDIWEPNCDALTNLATTSIREEDKDLTISHFITYSGVECGVI